MNILLLEPFFTGSHAQWALGLQKFSRHHVEILSLKGQFWKWRMHGGAVTLAREFKSSNNKPDLLLATDMLDLSTFLALTRTKTSRIPSAVYFHENQFSYPWSPEELDVNKNRDQHYGFINYVSALAADTVFFNSSYNMDGFINGARQLLTHFPDNNEPGSIAEIKAKSRVLYLGLDLARFDPFQKPEKQDVPLILWNHRWEFDKNPDDFFQALFLLQEKGYNFNVAILGEHFTKHPDIFDRAKKMLGNKIVVFGYVDSFNDYARWLWKADIIPVTSSHDFFGASVMEAVYCNCYPLLPNRLAYPELIPRDSFPQFYYQDLNDLVDRLEQLIANIAETRRISARQFSVKFEWGKYIEQYDNCFEETAHS